VKHSIEWQDDASNAAPEERATVGDLRLFIKEQNVTQYLLDGQVEEHITIALYGLAHGLTHDWWKIFGARDHVTSLARYRTGYLLPNIRLRFDGAVFEISAHQLSYENPDLRFWGGISEIVPRADGEAWLSLLVQEILERLSARGIKDTSAALRWKRVQASNQSNDEKAFCEAVGGLGMDPYQISGDVAEFVEESEKLFDDRETLVEFVSGATNVDRTRLIEWVQRMTRTKSTSYRLADLRATVQEIEKAAPPKPNERAWALGYRRAQAMRQRRGLKQHHRFSSFRDLARVFGASKGYTLARKVDGINALRSERNDGIHVFLRNHGDSPEAKATHLFALARSIGDAACFPRIRISPINGLQYAFRQAAGRAFAAEFLAPIDEVLSMQNDKRDVYSIANELAVSPAVIEHQIENNDRIAQACA
jgi:hypothetical protein